MTTATTHFPTAALGWGYDRLDRRHGDPIRDTRTLVSEYTRLWGMTTDSREEWVLLRAAAELVEHALRRGAATVTIYRTDQGWACLSVGSDGGVAEEPPRLLRHHIAASNGRMDMVGGRVNVFVPTPGVSGIDPGTGRACGPIAVGETFDLISLTERVGTRVLERLRHTEAAHTPVLMDVRSRRMGFLVEPDPDPATTAPRRCVVLPPPPGSDADEPVCRWLHPPLRARVGSRSLVTRTIAAVREQSR